jgi:hypothetical protein
MGDELDREIDCDMMGATQKHKNALNDILNRSLEDAKKIFSKKYPRYRLFVCWVDGVDQMTTKDIDYDRLNVGVVNGIVVNEYKRTFNEDGSVKSWRMALWG